MGECICSIPGCGRPWRSFDWCDMHYKRWRRHGDPEHERTRRIDATPEVRFWAKVDRRGPDDCWLWTGSTRWGYGQMSRGRQGAGLIRVHRFAYELLVGPIPAGLHLDHLCHNADPTCAGGSDCPHRRCVNPAHLEPTTQTVNTQRAFAHRRAAREGGGA